MKTNPKYLKVIVIAFGLVLSTNLAVAKKEAPPPDTTHDGLVRVESPKSDLVYLLPDVDLSPYTEFLLMEPYVAFNKDWVDYYNGSAGPFDRLSDKDLEKMISRIKEQFAKAFTKALEKKGFPVVKEPARSALIVRPAVINIQVSVPDPDRTKGMGRGGVYAEDAGTMSFYVELYDSVSQQILARAIDTETEINYGWRIPRDYSTNRMAADSTFQLWAKRLANGLENAKESGLVLVELDESEE